MEVDVAQASPTPEDGFQRGGNQRGTLEAAPIKQGIPKGKALSPGLIVSASLVRA